MFRTITALSVRLVQNYLPSPFVFCILLTVLVYAAAVLAGGQTPAAAADAWGKGLWSLLGFSMQMALILATGHVLAKAPAVSRLLDGLAARVRSPRTAVVTVTLVSLAACWINWGFGLVAGAVLAKALARQVKGTDYPLLVASAYSGFLIWHGGLSGSIPLALATEGADLLKMSGGTVQTAVPVAETLFSPLNLSIVAGLLVGLPLMNMLMMPKNPVAVEAAKLREPEIVPPPRDTPAQRWDDSRLAALVPAALGGVYLYGHFSGKGFNLALNIVIAVFLFAGLLAHGTPERYSRAVEESVKGIAGIVLLFPFYGGIMGLMTAEPEGGMSLAAVVSNAFAAWSDSRSFPVLAFLSAGLVNVFVPSGGGQWAVQGPIMLPAGVELGVSPVVSAMAVAWGDAWTNMVQPFWALPLLGIAGLDARAVMGYCLMALLYAGVLISAVFLFLV
ncbi:TIGR00366 family protein [Neisseria leonii]|uniref:TIGR00366 family protein n=1 Tax=Neisseria leonii TaxID=2995413 RepID=A0A9X4IEB2_9NEIS|nr:TIGR00366 family protein [Neisseria sp. 51.81]MDD9328571.1 TIGR00366 family protein [Neisseria sp. 51.81]